MKTLDTEKEKIHRICEILKKDTLEPAEKKAALIIEEAEKKADEILRQAEKQAEELLQKAKDAIHQEKKVFQSSLAQSVKQSLETLKQEIEKNLFRPHLDRLVERQLKNPHCVADIIEALIKAIKKESLSSSLIAYIPDHLSKEDVNHLLLVETVKDLKNNSVELGNFKGGAKVKLIDKNMTLEMTESAVKELMVRFIRTDFRKYFFND